jgi:hypothetical protein
MQEDLEAPKTGETERYSKTDGKGLDERLQIRNLVRITVKAESALEVKTLDLIEWVVQEKGELDLRGSVRPR